MKKVALFIVLIVCAISFSLPAWSKNGKEDGDPPVVKTNKADQVISRKDGDPPVVKSGRGLKTTQDIYDGDPPAPPK
jgi:uncharacterized protein YxeA